MVGFLVFFLPFIAHADATDDWVKSLDEDIENEPKVVATPIDVYLKNIRSDQSTLINCADRMSSSLKKYQGTKFPKEESIAVADLSKKVSAIYEKYIGGSKPMFAPKTNSKLNDLWEVLVMGCRNIASDFIGPAEVKDHFSNPETTKTLIEVFNEDLTKFQTELSQYK